MRKKLNRMTGMIKFFIFLASMIAFSYGRVGLGTTDSDVSIGLGSSVWLETGQMVDFFQLDGAEKNHQWLQRSFLNVILDASIGERIKVAAGIEGAMWLNVPKGGASSQQYYIWRYNSTFIVDRAFGSYSWGDSASPFLSLAVGRFPYKYNPQSRNLGEYLFRSGTYPAYLINTFDQPFARLTGLRLSGNLLKCLRHDLMLTFETDIPPYYDATLSYIADVDVGKFLSVGAGFSWAHLISVDESQTTPNDLRTKYYSSGDSAFYSFRGIKLMGRMCFDPKPFIPLSIFGKEDLKIYAEAAILGVQNYPANDSDRAFATQRNNIWGYDTLKKKAPLLIGFNIPACKVLDVVALEAEWYGCPYPNNYANVLGKGNIISLPLPDYYNSRPRGYTRQDNWKWSLYIKKMFIDDHFGVVAQFARDHMRMESLLDEAKFYDLEEALSINKQWWWMMKLVAQF